jgi:hypothetical protein
MAGEDGIGCRRETTSIPRSDSSAIGLFQAIDKTQVIFAGRGPNRTQPLIMKRSILIEVYRSAHQMIENNFYLTHRTIRHSSPRMTHTINKLRNYIEGPEQRPHIFTAGRSVNYEIPDHVSDGLALLMEDTDLCAIADGDEGRAGTATGDDLGIN